MKFCFEDDKISKSFINKTDEERAKCLTKKFRKYAALKDDQKITDDIIKKYYSTAFRTVQVLQGCGEDELREALLNYQE